MPDSLVVVSAHAADFIWRAGGVIASYTRRGWGVTVLVLSLGVRGESAELWRAPGQTAERVAADRREESVAGAAALGCAVEFFDLQDYRISITPEVLETLALRLRALRPTIMLTHSARDPFNPDHPLVHQASVEARLLAGVPGIAPGNPVLPPPRLYAFEPHQAELSGFVPDVYVDITADFDTKLRAMRCIASQTYLVDYHTKLAELRAYQARRNWSHKEIAYAEAFQHCVPIVADALP